MSAKDRNNRAAAFKLKVNIVFHGLRARNPSMESFCQFLRQKVKELRTWSLLTIFCNCSNSTDPWKKKPQSRNPTD